MIRLITKSAWLFLFVACATLSSCSFFNNDGDNDYLSVQIEDSNMWSLLDVGDGKLVMTDEFLAPASGVVKGSFFVQNDKGEFDLYNLSDTKNKLNSSPYSIVTNFNSDGYAIARVKDESWEIIDVKGTTVATLEKDINVLSGFTKEGLALIENTDGLCGFVNTKGEEQIKPQYSNASIFSDGIAFVLAKKEDDHNYFAAIDPTGKTVFAFSDAMYSDISLFKDGHTFAVEGDQSVLLDKMGKKVMTVCDGTNISDLSYQDGKVIYYDGEFYGVKETSGEILIRPKYKNLKFQSDGNLMAVNGNEKYGVISSSDEIILPFDYDELDYLAPGRYITKTGNVHVIINDEGKEISEKAFSNFVNRSASANEINRASLISADDNNADNNDADFSLSDIAGETDDESSDNDSGFKNYWFPQPGKYNAIIDNKTKVVIEITSNDGSIVKGYVYYPNTVAKYGKNSHTLMPMSGTMDGISNCNLTVKGPSGSSNSDYSEQWELWIGDVMAGGTIYTSTGKQMEISIDV